MVYLPHETDLPRWKDLANAAGISLSNFVFEAVENFIDTRDKQQQSRAEAVQRSTKLLEELKAVKEELRTTKLALKTVENDNSRLRQNAHDWLSKIRSSISNNEVFRELFEKRRTIENLDLKKESKDDKNVYRQLTALQDAGIIIETKHGWRLKSDAE
jgi:predicted nuclease with TOPRIM domain